MSGEAEKRCGIVAVIGAPNAGKSTLINALVGSKVTIVSSKPQTTRTVVRGIAMHDRTQVIFADTPGIFLPRKKMERAMVGAAWSSEKDADAVMVVVDALKGKPDGSTRHIIEKVAENRAGRPCILVLNKADKARKENLLLLAATLNKEFAFDATFMVSALREDGVKDILSWLSRKLPAGEWAYPEDDVSDMPMRLMAAEITREKLFRGLHEELPYGLTVETEEWENFEDGSIRIGQVIFIARAAHKPILLGRAGTQIKEIGEESRRELETILETRVHLNLFVKVQENWQDDPDRYAPWGLDSSS